MKPKNINIPKAFFPNSFTAFNALCGFLSIVQSSLGNFDLAFYFIVFGSLFDLFDGMVDSDSIVTMFCRECYNGIQWENWGGGQ